MKRVKAVGAVMVAAAAVCAMAASSASATNSPLWLNAAGVLKTSSEQLLFTASKRSGTGDFKLESNNAVIECSGVASHGLLVGGMPGTVSFASGGNPTFSGCEEIGAPECIVKGLNAANNGEVEITASSRLVYINSGETKVGELFEGSGSGKEFVTLYLSGTNCSTKTPTGPQKVTGSVIGEISPEAGNMVEMTGLLIFPKATLALYTGGNKVVATLKAFGTAPALEVGEEEVLADGEWGVTID